MIKDGKKWYAEWRRKHPKPKPAEQKSPKPEKPPKQ